MHKHTDIHSVSGTSWHGHEIVTTAARLTELFGEATFDAPSCDGSQMEWALEHDSMAITIYDRRSASFDAYEPVCWHIGAHNRWNASVAYLHLINLLNGQTTEVRSALAEQDLARDAQG